LDQVGSNGSVGWKRSIPEFAPNLIPGLKAGHSLSEAVIPDTCVFQRCRWQAEGQRNILFHEGLPLLGAEDRRMEVVAWLRGLGLEQYAPAFRDNDIDLEVLPELTTDDLISIGVTSVGHRRKLLAAIAAFGRDTPQVFPENAAAAEISSEAERRQLTVMFCDLVGSTPLAVRYDPEDLREVIGTYYGCVADAVARFAGFIAKYMGDGILIYFGYPKAHEDDAERAVRAGLALIEAVARLATPEPLNVRLGIASGLVVVGDLIGEGSAREQSVVGETPNLAARLQSLAQSGVLVIAESTRRQIGALFEVQDLGPQHLPGFADPQRAWRVIGESGVISRFEALRTGETRLIGRDEEIELLCRRWAQAKAGAGRAVLISAEPGIGKSRLAEAFRQALEEAPYTRLRYFCSPHHQDSALFPFIVQLERAAGFERDDIPAIRLVKLEALVAPNEPAEGDVQILAELLSLPLDRRYAPLDLTPQRKKEKTFEALLRQLAGVARRQPVLMIFEDLHWADPSSRELLDLMVGRVERLPVLLIATFRPEFEPPWTGQPHVTTVSLRRLGQEESRELVRGLIHASATLSGEVVNEIVERTDGVPLFIEELTKAILENAIRTIPVTSSTVPATLHASLMARLDRLGPTAKEIAQIGSAIGREFSYHLLIATSQRPAAQVQDGLGSLVNAGLVFQRGAIPEAAFSFKHALVQDAAHGTLLRAARQRLHARIAEALEAHSAELMDIQPELFAQHYAEAGVVEKSVVYWSKAGHRSGACSAMAEAAAQYQKGLDQLALLPNTVERQRQELEFCSARSMALQASKGYAAPETGQAYARALKLWEKLGSPSEFLQIPYGQSLFM
jgi:class 3 adenylate cyclase